MPFPFITEVDVLTFDVNRRGGFNRLVFLFSYFVSSSTQLYRPLDKIK
jgi:hypothetical protein